MEGGDTLVQYILDKVAFVKKRYHTSNPFDIASFLNIIVRFHNLGNLQGYYTSLWRLNYIVINSALTENMKNVICSHELGHSFFHKEFANSVRLEDYTLFDLNSKLEREANLFAAELLISDESIFEAINFQNSLQGIASMLNVPAELLDFKCQALSYKGYNLNSSLNSRADFLKNCFIKADF